MDLDQDTSLQEKANTNIDAFVADYLRRKGYHKAVEALQEAGITPLDQLQDHSEDQIVNVIKYHSEESKPTVYDANYKAFKNWAQTSLDMYRPELLSILYPIFIHCYLDLVERGNRTEAALFLQKHRSDHGERHQHEIQNLQNITKPEHMKENNLVQTFRGNKFNVTMCSYSFELLLSYLHERKFVLLLSIINQYINIKVHPGQPKQREQDELYTPISGEDEKNLTLMNEKPIYWGLFEEQKKLYPNFEEEGKQPKKQKHEDGDDSPDPSTKVTLPGLSSQTEMEILDDLRKRVQLGPSSLPSICCATFFNTYNTLNKVRVSPRGNLIAAGFQDSSIRLWDLEYESSKWNKATKKFIDTDGRDPRYKPKRAPGLNEGEFYQLIGHSGPIYGLSFSPDSQFLLSCSEDTTIRLWSMETKTNIVCYRGHSYPVWDVEFSPLGYYFATASHDKTARLWATNHLHPLRIFAGHLSDVNCVKFHPNCNYIVTGSSDKCVRVWDVNSGDCVRVFTGHSASIHSIALSNDGRFIASSGEDRDIIIWDLSSSSRVATWRGLHKGTVWSLMFSSEGDILASGAQDCSVRLWDIKTLREEIIAKEKEEEEHKKKIMLPNNMEMDTTDTGPTDDKTLLPKPEGDNEDDDKESDDEDVPLTEAPEKKPAGLLATYPTKKTPVLDVHFTRTNLLMVAGVFKSNLTNTSNSMGALSNMGNPASVTLIQSNLNANGT